ncbi:surfactin synthase thioesterase subunit [Kitasatospora sp. MAA4]|uniref:thioesterase II family protein n=1 Tax=Kitasatospora sp. MAA4 TaxID=3035093 RepID=UPI00247459F2|nr:alpha/beta fold hydrolase [Kitasatospora sp. MAA4]MDH6135474.1 surfactin synthase thioesterase subunit [Kitasatospora sp. MAA4]
MPAPLSGWLQPETASVEAPLRLFLFHCAGGGASMYHAWPRLFPSDIAVQCVQLTGRQERFDEDLFTELDPLLDALAELVAAEDDGRPFGFFGHSMGALIAYRLAVRLERSGLPGPSVVGAAGWAPEEFTMPARHHAELTDAELVAELAALGALPPDAVGADADWLALAVPAMRADISLCEGYRDDRGVIRAPLAGYAGASDPLMAPDALASWAARTEAYLGGRVFPGGHFFLDREAPAIAMDLAQLLRRHAGR